MWHQFCTNETSYLGIELLPSEVCNRLHAMIKHINDSRYKALIDWLKAARIEQGLTVRDLGKLLDEPHQFVVRIETCERKLNVFEYVQYCDALKLNPTLGIEKLESSTYITLK